jgi:peptidoglycan/LPS O-acetylase OafA/YrhL
MRKEVKVGQSENSSTQAKRIVFLDYLRIFAFLSVLIGHKFYGHAVSFASNEAAHSTPRLITELLLPIFQGGGAGVVVFFLISGYIITFVLQTEQPTEFIIKRIFRIYPLYVSAVLLQTIMQFLSSGELPDLLIIVPQLLLIGDLFGTPYTLAGAEWTLRLEVLFYAFMVVLRYLGLLHEYKRYFPLLLIITCLTLGGLAPIPSFDIWSKGYVTIYGPFLLLGSFFYLKEARQVSSWFLAAATILILIQYYYLMGVYQPRWIGAHFATLSVLIFFFSWRYRSAFAITPFVLLLSDLTYSVYIFHNWTWIPIKTVLEKLSIAVCHPDTQALIVLFLLCFLLLRLVEKPGIRLGKSIVSRIKKSA